MKIQIISDNEGVRKSLEDLQDKNFEIFSSENTISGMSDCRESKPDVVIVDSQLVGIPDALNIVARLSKTMNNHFLVVGCNSKTLLIEFYNIGASNCIASYDVDLIQSILKSIDSKIEKQKNANGVTFGDFRFDYARRICKFKSQDVKLSPTEFSILNYLIANIGKAISRDEIEREVFEGSLSASSNTVDVHVNNMRNKLGAKGVFGAVRTVRAVGYAFSNTRLLEMANKS